MLTIILLVTFLFISFFACVFCLWSAARLFRVPQAGFLRYLSTVIVVWLISFLLLALLQIISPSTVRAAILELVLIFPLTWVFLTLFLRTSFPKAMLVSLLWAAFNASFAVVLVFLIKSFVFEAYVIDSNNMAPTLIGPHHQAACPHCAKTLIVPFVDPQVHHEPEEWAICPACLKMSKVSKWDAKILPPDRFICNKLLSPRRWDLIVFRPPDHPNAKWVDRLVGLPGEELVIKEGAIWINGSKVELPPEIAGLEFTDNIDGMPIPWGSAESPARLGPDEYFVVGDFAHRSSDSRMWKGVPGSNIEGVATLIYWPLDRWRVFR